MPQHSMTTNPIAEDLLTRIIRETNERMAILRDAVDERERLQKDLRKLEAQPEVQRDDLGIEDAAPVDPEAEDMASGMGEAGLHAGEADPGDEENTPAHVDGTPQSPTRRQRPRTRMTPPKIGRRIPGVRRSSLERPNTSARRKRARAHSSPGRDSPDGLEVDPFPEADLSQAIDEVDIEAQRYELSI
jgi:hypothetical protein